MIQTFRFQKGQLKNDTFQITGKNQNGITYDKSIISRITLKKKIFEAHLHD